MKTSIALIVAADENNGIGKGNDLPWKLPSEMCYFMETTKNHVIIMGRKSFEAIGKPLKNRYNIVMTRDINYEREGILVVSSLEEAIFFAKLIQSQDSSTYESDYIFITGGGEVYKQALESGIVTHLFFTRVHHSFDCDTYFPAFDWQQWKVIKERFQPQNDQNQYDYTIYVLEKK
jgi:dihydrofolate reductase